MGEEVDVAWAEDKTAAELEGVLAQAVLPVAAGGGACSCSGVAWTQEVEHRGLLQAGGPIGLSPVVDQQRKGDAGLILEGRGVAPVAKADRGQSGTRPADLLLVVAQLRDVLAAKNSAVVAQEHQHGGAFVPK